MPPASPTECSTDHRFLLSWVCHALNVIFVVQKLLKKTKEELNYWAGAGRASKELKQWRKK